MTGMPVQLRDDLGDVVGVDLLLEEDRRAGRASTATSRSASCCSSSGMIP